MKRLPKKQFYPEQVFKDTVAIFIAFAILFVMAVAVRVPLEQLADPTDTTYIPRPEWYFLFLFQTLKLFNGPLEVVGSVVLPGLAVLALILMPFIDRGKMIRVTRRTVAIGVVVLAALGWTGLTAAAVTTTPTADNAEEIDFGGPPTGCSFRRRKWPASATSARRTAPVAMRWWKASPAIGPDLTNRPIHKIGGLDDPAFQAAGRHGARHVHAADSTERRATECAGGVPAEADAAQCGGAGQCAGLCGGGALVFQANHCGGCHLVNGVGMHIGPPLNGLARRRTKTWVVQHFANPQALSPGSIMPPYRFSSQEMDHLVAYLFILPD